MGALVGATLIGALIIGLVYSFRSIRQALGLTLIVAGLAFSLSGWGMIVGLPMVFLGGWISSL